MEPQSDRTPLVVIVGETASGKSALALKLAKRFDGEIIAADSRTLYKGMDIGTAKPSQDDQAMIRHHLLDITTPDRPVTVAEFKRLANAAINDIAARGKLPFLVGGTGLYIDAILYDFTFRPKGDELKRKKWQELSVDELQTELVRRNIPLPSNKKNPRHLIRQLETGGVSAAQRILRADTLVLGVAIEHDELEKRVAVRIEEMLDRGLGTEVHQLAEKYGWDVYPLQTIGYQEFEQQSLGKQLSPDELKHVIKVHTMQLAKRQRAWFRRNKSIHWIWKEEEAVDLITSLLNK